MTDAHADEQEMEVEALQAILMEDFQEMDGSSPSGWPDGVRCYSVPIQAADEDAPDIGVSTGRCDLILAHTPQYPDEAPLIKISNVQGLSNQELAALQALIDEQIEANMGMAMLYTIVSAAQEWMRQRVVADVEPEVNPEEARRQAIAAEEARLAEQRAHGTPVTPENFVQWRHKLRAEEALERAKLGEEVVAAEKTIRLTGKQFFEVQDTTAAAGHPEAGAAQDLEAEISDEDDLLESDLEDEDDDGMLDEYLAAKR